ncbi:WD40-repeat-containing domain protein [Cokeromyces recurvatus]|uniref:WD40-repeat-containing domain protein n=1 Tax=Cokeromyces recurvatus TaxID=90255 RepID=UPI00221E3810|nr:WD40-repeat-containing domain protein [Cokeromyces recurvatus]KAI7904532.1 WD40-repeat-containing domain protein [Cokeromyces recurvatus]
MDTSRNTHYYSYPQQRIPAQDTVHSSPQSKEIYQYDAPWLTYALDWCKTPNDHLNFRLAIGSFIEDSNNKLQIISRTDLLPDTNIPIDYRNDFTVIAETDSYYPITKVLWEPRRNDARNNDLLATTGDILRIWELVDEPRYLNTNSINSSSRTNNNRTIQKLVKKAELVNMKQTDFSAPLTSFDWNETDPSIVVTSSIDTTCTVWNVETNQAKTQLIAHDSDVYDVAFMHGSADTFASVGADGSVRLFDLRSLEHSTILYEAPPISTNHQTVAGNPNAGTTTVPLLRLQFSRMNSNLLATFHMDSNAVEILDIRYPSAPIAELCKSHSGSINCISWSPTESGQIATGGDDSQVLVWNINHTSNDNRNSTYYQNMNGVYGNNNNNTQQRYNGHPSPRSIQDPLLAYVADAEVNSITWSKSAPDWIGIGFGRTIQALRV